MFIRGNNVSKVDSNTRDPLTVTELTQKIKHTLESRFPSLWIKGEVSNFKKHSSGHFYFSLKDTDSQISCVMWKNKNRNLLFQLQDGMKIIVLANINVYIQQGRYQLNIQSIRPLGVGELQVEFEKLKKRLSEEGLFNKDHKKSIPRFVQTIGLVTSPSGAAVHDIKTVLQRRFPSVNLLLWPVNVQGDNAARQIAEGIAALNQYKKIELIIVGRGGGSLEDLWPFNEEVVARAIYSSIIPVISAVGHEIDFSISDLVADKRAPTPSAAAEIAVPDKEELLKNIIILRDKIVNNLTNLFDSCRQEIQRIEKSYGIRRPSDRLREYSLRLDDVTTHFITLMKHKLATLQSRIDTIKTHINALNPSAVLKRGYSITIRVPDGKIINKAVELHKKDTIQTKFSQGSVDSLVENIKI